MKRIAFLTALTMLIPAAAYGWPYGRTADRDDQPRTVFRDRDHDRDDPGWSRERYDRYDRSRWSRDFHGRWVPLAQGYSARTDRQFINLGGYGRYRKLRIEAVRGEPVLLKIAIEFANGTNQAVEYREALPAGTGEVIDLNGDVRRIKRIIIYTDPRSRGSYSIYGA
jgi:hypothetical protein